MKLDVAYFNSWSDCNGNKFPPIVTQANQYVFASRHVEDAKDVICAASDLSDVDPRLLAKIRFFDAFIHNTDRTTVNSNLLINGGIHVIDHNNAFDSTFDRDNFEREHVLTSLISGVDDRDITAFKQEFCDVATSAFLDSVWSEMPVEWTEPGEVVLPLDYIKKQLLVEERV